jgi:hypothetical protein
MSDTDESITESRGFLSDNVRLRYPLLAALRQAKNSGEKTTVLMKSGHSFAGVVIRGFDQDDEVVLADEIVGISKHVQRRTIHILISEITALSGESHVPGSFQSLPPIHEIIGASGDLHERHE